ncbi:MAG: hypothetical protein IJ230_02965 [Clostridia bacterium]|nr:hypothetical protein [Clostridia bacterium]
MTMKRFLIIAASLLLCLTAYSQSFFPKDTIKGEGWSQKDSLQMHLLNRVNQKAAPGFKLYKTDNMWTFIRLETATGRLSQIHYSVGNENQRGVLSINDLNLGAIYGSGDNYFGRFELYKTENMYNFILLDTESGAVWQAQWSFNADNRGIVRIYEY